MGKGDALYAQNSRLIANLASDCSTKIIFISAHTGIYLT